MSAVLGFLFKPLDWVLFSPDKNNRFLEGCYAPVKDELTSECEVEGVIPEALYGEFVRMGPNPRFTPKGGYHWFDGDGMAHAVRIKSDKVVYSNRYVKTAKLAREEEEGSPVFDNFGELSGSGALLRFLSYMAKKSVGYIPWKPQSRANTSIEYHAGQLMALWEGGLPYAVKVMCDGVIETMGEMTFNGKLKTPFTAHPKKDPVTGKLYGIGFQFDAKPYVTFFVLDAEGNIERQFPLPVDRPCFMHDFSITETHAIFMDLPLLMDPGSLLSGKLPLVFKKEMGSRVGALPLNATDASSMRWYDYPEGFFSFHSLNGWNIPGTGGEGSPEKVQVVSCDSMEFDIDFKGTARSHANMPRPYVTTLDLNKGEITHKELLPVPGPSDKYTGYDFPVIRRSTLGRKSRYGYFSEIDGNGDFVAVSKMDLEAASPKDVVVGRIVFGEDVRGGECPFIPAGDEEDDGYLATFITRADGIGNSDLCVWDAKTMNSTPVARVKLPQRVPLGFHALFLSEADLAMQQESH